MVLHTTGFLIGFSGDTETPGCGEELKCTSFKENLPTDGHRHMVLSMGASQDSASGSTTKLTRCKYSQSLSTWPTLSVWIKAELDTPVFGDQRLQKTLLYEAGVSLTFP